MESWIMAAASLYVLAALLVYALQGQMLYNPGSRLLSATPKDAGLEYRDFELSVEPGVKVHGWLVPPPGTPPEDGIWSALPPDREVPPPFWVHFSHGNTGNISQRLEITKVFHSMGLGVCLYDYRGYGKSVGQPSVEGTRRDAVAVWEMLTKEVPAERAVVWGHSLGGAVAGQLAAHLSARGTPFAALVLEGTFTSVVAMGKRRYPFLPVRLLCRYPYDNVASLKDVRAPVLVIHSPQDEAVPQTMGRRLYDLAHEPKEFLEIRGDHERGSLDSGELFTQGVRRFLEGLAD